MNWKHFSMKMELSSVCFKQDFRWCLNENGFEYEDILQGMRNTLNEILGKNHKPHVYPTLRGVLPNV